MRSFTGKVAVITGAGSGIGRALALELARRGAKLALSDVDTEGLAETESLVRATGAEVRTDRLDVTEREAVMAYAETVAAHYGVINQIYNNAGIAYHGDVLNSEFKDIERIIDVDFWGVVNGTKVFLPHLIASGDGHVVNISSLFGLLAMPSQSAYNAAKFAVRGFTESLRLEMLMGKHPVAVTCVHPGGIKTAIARNATVGAGYDQKNVASTFDNKLTFTTAESAAKTIVRAVGRRRPRVIVGYDAVVLDAFVRATASGYQRVVAGFASRIAPKQSL